MSIEEDALAAFGQWYAELPTYAGGFPARGTIGAALIVLERLKEDYVLNLDSHRAERGRSQIRGVSGTAVARILANFGETRHFISEGGRTNRGGAGDIESMLQCLQGTRLHELPPYELPIALNALQGFLVEKVREFHGRERLEFVFDPAKTTRQIVLDILTAARETNKEGPVAQYLVGAKLQLRFPKIKVNNESFSTADQQLGRHGDYLIGDTAFHVTVAPMPGVYERCKTNIDSGMRVYLLVPEKVLVGARQNAEQVAQGRIAVESIESFIGQNVEELSNFSRNLLAKELLQLLEIYNLRVDETESDKSMLIEIPDNLRTTSRD